MEQAPAAVMALGGGDNAGLAQFTQDAPHHDRIGHEALRQGGRGDGGVGLLVQVDKGVKGEREAA
ncbi:hypothetical protein D9M68_884890 [compost metagenome]